MKRSDYAFPCGGCICNHCANNLYSEDKTAGEAKIFCDACEWCRWYDGDTKNPDKWKQECDEYIITEEQAKKKQEKIQNCEIGGTHHENNRNYEPEGRDR